MSREKCTQRTLNAKQKNELKSVYCCCARNEKKIKTNSFSKNFALKRHNNRDLNYYMELVVVFGFFFHDACRGSSMVRKLCDISGSQEVSQGNRSAKAIRFCFFFFTFVAEREREQRAQRVRFHILKIDMNSCQ